MWKLWDMTPYAFITMIKTVLISQFIFKLTLLPTGKINTKDLLMEKKTNLCRFIYQYKCNIYCDTLIEIELYWESFS